MKTSIFLLTIMAVLLLPGPSQSAPVAAGYFPEDNELGNILHLSKTTEFEDSAKLSGIADGKLISAVGFLKYYQRTYSGKDTSLDLEIFELLDSRASYALLTLLRKAQIESGPPGDFYAKTSDGICFSQGRRFVRIHSLELPAGIQDKAAVSISKRMAIEHGEPPSVISHLPQSGYDSSSLRYFPAISAYKNYVNGKSAAFINTQYDMEIAQARYFADSRSGMLFLLKLPTPELAEAYFAELAIPSALQADGLSVYANRAGPLVAILEGNFDPRSADKLLKSVKFSYSVRWVYEKKNNTKIIWGVPIGILGAVVNSLLFVAILCVASMFLGAIVAVVRYLFSSLSTKHSSGDDNETHISQLRL
jgi:hypothetical protein